MRFVLTPEQDELRLLVRSYAADKMPLSATRLHLDKGSGFDPVDWVAIAGDLGLAGVDVAETYGGAGLGAVELAIAAVELGAVLYSGPFLAGTGFATGLLRAADPESNPGVADLLTRVVRGEIVISAIPDDGGRWRPESVFCAADGDPQVGWTITGTKNALLQANRAGLFLVAARTAAGSCGLFAVEPQDVRVQPVDSLDPTRALFRLDLDAAPAKLLVDGADSAISAGYLRACVVLAAECLGGARACLDMATQYARSRVQFGRPIGGFQAVKHRLVDALVEVELAMSAVYLAACHLATDDPAAHSSASMALHSAAETFSRVAADNVQIHGGIAFTWEHDAHLFVKRARTNRQLLGRPVDQLDAVYQRSAEPG